MLKKSYEAFKVTIENKVAHIQMSRPEAMNTMNKAFWNELPEIVRTIDTEALARVIVISSTGKHFSAGMDTTVFTGPRPTGPQDRYVASRCRWEFGSGQCGYVVNAVAAYTTCPKTLSACIARGQDHAARGLPVLHPARFGGFPGIPRQR